MVHVKIIVNWEMKSLTRNNLAKKNFPIHSSGLAIALGALLMNMSITTPIFAFSYKDLLELHHKTIEGDDVKER